MHVRYELSIYNIKKKNLTFDVEVRFCPYVVKKSDGQSQSMDLSDQKQK